MAFWASIKWRVFVFYTTLIALVLAVAAGLHAFSARAGLEGITEARLRSEGFRLLPQFFPPPIDEARTPPPRQPVQRKLPTAENRIVQDALERCAREGWFFFTMDAGGQVTYRSRNAPPSLAHPELFQHAGVLGAVALPDFLTVAVRSPLDESLVIGMSRAALHAEFRGVLVQSAAVALVILAVASLAGFAILQRGLRPIQTISETAQKIAEGDLSGRIDGKFQRSELGQLAQILNSTFDRLADVLKRQVRFTADASHELRTPVAAILADCQFSLKKERSPERYRETIEVCHESAQHMRVLIDRLSLLARFDAHDNVLDLGPVDLRDLAESALAVTRPVAEENGLAITVKAAPAPVVGDAARLGQVVINLLTNAVRYNRPGGSITVRTGRDGDTAFLEVTDTGLGIPADKLARVFDRFYRVDDSRHVRTGGTGLGLAICQTVVQAHHGRITVQSDLDHSSTFRIELPAA
jgi:two-component system, OmpR family, sensor kinase